MNGQSDDIKIKDPKKMDDDELLELLNKHVDSWFSFFKDNIIEGRDRKRFAFGDQWDEQVAEEYKNTGKVMLTTNKLNPHVRRLVGEVRAFTPALSVKRTDELRQNDEMPKIIENHIRKVSLNSDAKTAYQTAFRDEIVSGFGVVSACLEFKDENSFEQKIVIQEQTEPERVGFDPSAKDITKSNGDYSFEYQTMSKSEFKNTYGFVPNFDAEPLTFGEKFTFEWINEDNVTLLDFYLKEYFDKTLVLLKNGQSMDLKEYNKMVDFVNDLQEQNPDQINPQIMDEMEIVQKRKVKDYKIMNYKFIKDKILEKKKWPSRFLPHVFIDGDSYFLEGKQYTQPFIKDAIDSQRMLNFVNTEIVQNIKDANNEDYLVTPSNIKGFEKMWKDKKRRKGALIANPDKKTGQMPQKQPPSQINPQLQPMSLKLENDIKSCLGIFQSNEGSSQSDLSGVAELTRITQGNLSTFVYVSNLNKGIEQLGRCVLSLMQNTLQSTQKLEGVDESGEETSDMINQPLPFGGVQNDINDGTFDVAIAASSAFAIQKMQEYREILSYVSAFPQMAQVVPDIAALKLSSDSRYDIASRASETLPLEIKAQDKDNPQAAAQAQKQLQQQQQQQQQMQQMQIQMQQMGAQIKMMAEKKKGDASERTSNANMMNAQTNRMEANQKSTIEAARLQTEQNKAAMDLEKEKLKFASSAMKAV